MYCIFNKTFDRMTYEPYLAKEYRSAYDSHWNYYLTGSNISTAIFIPKMVR